MRDVYAVDLPYPTVLSVERDEEDENLAWVVIDDGWGIEWDLEYERHDGAWQFNNAVTRKRLDDGTTVELDIALDPPESLLAIGLAALEKE